MKWRWSVLILLFAALIYATNHVRPGPSIKPGERHPFTLTTLEDKAVTETNPDGGVTVIEFWATWCGPCLQELPHLQALRTQHADDHVRFIGVSLDDEVATQRDTIEKLGLDGWVHVNEYQQKRSLAVAWNVIGLPHTFLFSPTGELLWDGYPSDLDEPLAAAIAKYKAE